MKERRVTEMQEIYDRHVYSIVNPLNSLLICSLKKKSGYLIQHTLQQSLHRVKLGYFVSSFPCGF